MKTGRSTNAAFWSRSITRRAAVTSDRLADQALRLAVEVKRSPLLGEHTDEILDWLGHGKDDITALHKEGAV